MTIDKLIAAGSLITSAFSALAAFLAIRQTIIQRLTAIKPQLIVKEITFKIDNLGHTEPLLNILGKNKNDIFINVINIGLGAALNIRYKWNFDYEKSFVKLGLQQANDSHFEKDLNDLICMENYIYEISSSEDFKYIHFIGNGTSTYFQHKITPYELEYILPNAIDKDDKTIEIPELIIILKINELLKTSLSITKLYKPIEGPRLHIIFEDISGKTKRETFNSLIQLKRISIKAEAYDYEVIVRFKRTDSWIQRGRQKIRKGYAEWLESLK
ncbi:hypothetical protein [Cronobacter malonaticus]|uniref:hypothetical protein n=1 Tax=Cronobacter malonaticus TaxID=413503 RepID=UPI00131A39E3|nr:hypothetical protein [Cronobacter malonaticus]